MAQQHINTGSFANSGTGDPLRTCFIKTEENFNELYQSGFDDPFPYIGDAEVTGSLAVTQDIVLIGDITSSKIQVNEILGASDTTTKIALGVNQIDFIVAGTNFLKLSSIDPKISINPTNSSIVDFKVGGNSSQETLLFTDSSTNRVGIGTETPDEKLHVEGTIKASGYKGDIIDGDPLVAGQFFQTSSQALGGTPPYFQVICISQG